MFGDHALCGLLEEGAHGKSPKCLGGNLGDFGEFCKGLGPFTDRERAGVIIAQTENRAELDRILSEDSYYPNLANYAIHEFTPKMVATNIEQFKA